MFGCPLGLVLSSRANAGVSSASVSISHSYEAHLMGFILMLLALSRFLTPGIAITKPRCAQVFNIFHALDPLAFRCDFDDMTLTY
jgi:hypothetical protein